jgi:hypothetical protein
VLNRSNPVDVSSHGVERQCDPLQRLAGSYVQDLFAFNIVARVPAIAHHLQRHRRPEGRHGQHDHRDIAT